MNFDDIFNGLKQVVFEVFSGIVCRRLYVSVWKSRSSQLSLIATGCTFFVLAVQYPSISKVGYVFMHLRVHLPVYVIK